VIHVNNKILFDHLVNKYHFDNAAYVFPHFAIEFRNITEEEKTDFLNASNSESCFHFNNELKSAIIFLNNLKQECFEKLPAGIKTVSLNAVSSFNDAVSLKMPINGKIFDFKYAYVMGILNITPDSFSDGGKYLNKNTAVDYALKMLDEGADIIDIGGESTRPGSELISEQEELNRVLPVVSELKRLRPGAVISIDTNKSKVARQTLQEGADIINDISGGTYDPAIFKAVKNSDAVYVLMHIKGIPKNMQHNIFYNNLIEEIYSDLNVQLNLARAEGLNKIIIDPGIGFGKTAEHNLEIIHRISDFRSLGFPILIGLSRKGFLGKLFNFELNDRDFPSAVADTMSLGNGARIIRSHNVKFCRIVCNMFNKSI
jgi:dihydropteroate synthase